MPRAAEISILSICSHNGCFKQRKTIVHAIRGTLLSLAGILRFQNLIYQKIAKVARVSEPYLTKLFEHFKKLPINLLKRAQIMAHFGADEDWLKWS